jgi:beta-lactamase regulating signal transducer with metallopeptidase domain
MNALPPLLDAFLSASWRGAVLTLVVLALRVIFRRQVPAPVFVGSWVVVALVWLVPLALPVAWSPFNLAGRVADVAPLETVAWAETRESVATATADAPSSAASQRAVSLAPVIRPDSAATRVIVSRELVAWLWLGGAAVLGLAQFITGVWWKRRLRMRSGPAEPRLVAAFTEACQEMRIKRPPRLLVTSLVDSPALFGVWRARLLFPAGWAATLTEDDLRWVLRHELGHHARRDLWTLALLRVAAAVHWFNPVAWFVVRWARHDCELACDEFVLRRSASARPEDYGRTLLKVLGAQRRVSAVPSALGIVETKRQLLRRISMIMHYRPVGFRRALLGAALLGGLAVVGVTQEKGSAKSPEASNSRLTPAMGDRAQMRAQDLAEQRQWETSVKLDLRAVGVVGGVPVALIDADGEPMLVSRDFGILTMDVKEIDVATKQVTVTMRVSGLTRVLPLTAPRAIEFPEVDPKPMLEWRPLLETKEHYLRQMLPDAITMKWGSFNRETKEEILLAFLATGQLVQVNSRERGVSMSSSFLFERERQALQKERRERFLASLTPEQREKFGTGADRAVRLDAPKAEQEKASAEAKKSRAMREEVLANLTSEQARLYFEWTGKTPVAGQPIYLGATPAAPAAPK